MIRDRTFSEFSAESSLEPNVASDTESGRGHHSASGSPPSLQLVSPGKSARILVHRFSRDPVGLLAQLRGSKVIRSNRWTIRRRRPGNDGAW